MSKRLASPPIVINIESRTVVRILVLVVISLLFLAFLENIAKPLTLIIISLFLALALNPAVSWIASQLKNQSRAVATGTAYVLVIAVICLFLSIVVPPLVSQTEKFVRDVPAKVENLTDDNSAVRRFVDRYELNDEISAATENLKNRFSDISRPALSTASAIGSTIVSAIVVFVLTFMMLIEGPSWLHKAVSVMPKDKREHRRELAKKMYRVVVGYVNGQVIVAILGGVFATTMLFILSHIFDASINPIALGGIIFLFSLLPMIGAFIGGAIVVFACLLVSPPLALAVAIYFIVYQQIENATIQPYIQAKTNNLTPLIVFVAAILGIGIGGFLGAFLAIPAAGCIKVLIEDYYQNRDQYRAL